MDSVREASTLNIHWFKEGLIVAILRRLSICSLLKFDKPMDRVRFIATACSMPGNTK